MSIDYNEIGRRILRRRNVLDLTQEELAERANLSAAYLGNVERASSKCSIETLMKLCTALEVTPDYLLLGVDKEYRNDTLDEIKDILYRTDTKGIDFLKRLMIWYTEQNF